MPKGPGVPRTVLMGQRFWQQAEGDMEVARALLSQGTGFHVVVNLAHQSAEKALKAAYWHVLAEEPPGRRDLGRHAEQIAGRVGGFPAQIDLAIDLLEPMFERSRYPSGKVEEPIPAEAVAEGHAEAAMRSAEEVLEWVQTLLQQAPGRPQRKRRS